MKKILLLIMVICFASTVNVFSFSLVEDSGILKGIEDVLYDGSSYDVSFVDGTAFEIYGDPLVLPFSTRDDAWHAGIALLDILKATPYHYNTVNIYGLGTNLGDSTIAIPYLLEFNSFFNAEFLTSGGVHYTYDEFGNGIFSQASGNLVSNPYQDSSGLTQFVYTQWDLNAPEPVPTPEPGTFLLLGVGLGGLALYRRKMKK